MTTFKKIVIARIEELEILLKKNGGKTKTAQWIRELLEITTKCLGVFYMRNEKVITICNNADKVFGLTESGYLVVFDNEIEKWVVKGDNEVALHGQVVVQPIQTLAPQGKYRNGREIQEFKIERNKKSIKMMGLSTVLLGLLLLAVLLWYFIK